MRGDEVRGLDEPDRGRSEEGKVTSVIEGTEKERRLIGKRRAKNMILFSYSEGGRVKVHSNEPKRPYDRKRGRHTRIR